MHSTESRLARSIDYTESSIPYYCHVRIGAATWFKSFATQLSHFQAGSFSFSVSVSLAVGPFVHSKDHCYIYYFMSVESVTPAPRVHVKRSLDDDINEAQS